MKTWAAMPLLTVVVVCSGCGMYHSGRVSAPLPRSGGKVVGSSIRFEFEQAKVCVEAANYRRERQRLSYVGVPTFPAAWFGMSETNDKPHRLDIKVEISSKGDELKWWPWRMRHIASDAQTNFPCRVVEGYYPDGRDVKWVPNEPVPISKPKSWWTKSYWSEPVQMPFWISFAVDSNPRNDFSLVLEGLEAQGKAIEIPRIEFRGRKHSDHEVFPLF